jgi:hypothetical protein
MLARIVAQEYAKESRTVIAQHIQIMSKAMGCTLYVHIGAYIKRVSIGAVIILRYSMIIGHGHALLKSSIYNITQREQKA